MPTFALTLSQMLMLPIAQSGTPASAAEKIQFGPHLREWVARRIDTVDAWQRIENDFPPLGVLIIDPLSDSDRAKYNFGAALWPGGGGAGHVIASFGDLHTDFELERAFRQSLVDLVE